MADPAVGLPTGQGRAHDIETCTAETSGTRHAGPHDVGAVTVTNVLTTMRSADEAEARLTK